MADTFFLLGISLNNSIFLNIWSRVFLLSLVTRYSSCNDKGRSRLPEIETLNSLMVSKCFSKLYRLVLICGFPILKPAEVIRSLLSW